MQGGGGGGGGDIISSDYPSPKAVSCKPTPHLTGSPDNLACAEKARRGVLKTLKSPI